MLRVVAKATVEAATCVWPLTLLERVAAPMTVKPANLGIWECLYAQSCRHQWGSQRGGLPVVRKMPQTRMALFSTELPLKLDLATPLSGAQQKRVVDSSLSCTLNAKNVLFCYVVFLFPPLFSIIIIIFWFTGYCGYSYFMCFVLFVFLRLVHLFWR